MKWSLTMGELLESLGNAATEGEFGGVISGIADLRTAKAGELTFLSSRKYNRYLPETQASVIIVPKDQEGAPAAHQLWIRSEDPSLTLADVCRHLERGFKPRPKPGIHPTALVDAGAVVDESASIGPYCIVEDGARIGKEVILESHVRIDQEAIVGEGSFLSHGVHVGWGCRVGRLCRLFSGAVLGTDGFGYHSDASGHRALPQIGIVVLEDHVDLGANTAIDRARFAETRIGEGTKIDNLVQIGHNVTIGKHCIICAQVGIAGSTELGDFVVLAGQVGVGGHLKIGDGAKATGQTGITGTIEPGAVVGGNPSRPHREFLKRQALMGRLPEMMGRLRALEEGDGKA